MGKIKMNRILIKNFPNLNNYGTAMMGIVIVHELLKKYQNDIEIYLSVDSYFRQKELDEEIGIFNDSRIKFHSESKNNLVIQKFLGSKAYRIFQLLFLKDVNKSFNKIIVLGGDDFSEYYSKYITAIEIFSLWKSSFHAEIILLGQTIGPFKKAINRYSFKLLTKKFKIISRDSWTSTYFKENLKISINTMGDIAFSPLPNQEKISADKLLAQFDLKQNEYITLVISGLVEQGYYCNDRNLYLNCYKEIINELSKSTYTKFKKIVLLAHTYEPYGKENDLILELTKLLDSTALQNVIVITNKILPTRARIILGNGTLSITGRMHPAISTFQMGKPSITLSYSEKYKGVLGSIHRNDLIIESNDAQLWSSGEIIKAVLEKTQYVIENQSQLEREINSEVQRLKGINQVIYADL